MKETPCKHCLTPRDEGEFCGCDGSVIEMMTEALTEIRDLARTGLAPISMNMTNEQWNIHKLNKIARIANKALDY